MQLLDYGGVKVSVETTWNELDLRKALTIYQIIMQDTYGEIPADTELAMKKIEVYHALTGIDPVHLEVIRQSNINELGIEDGELAFYDYLNKELEIVEPFFETVETKDGQKVWMISETLTKCPYPILEIKEPGKVGKSKFFAPRDECDNITMNEFITLCSRLEAFEKTGDTKHLDNIIASFYRRPKPQTPDNLENKYEGDIRLPFVEGAVEWRQAKFRNMTDMARQLISFWLVSCRRVFANSYPLLFDDTDMEAPTNDRYKWLKFINALTNNDITKKNKTLNMRANDVLPLLEAMEDSRRKQKKDA
jgi:hypothetical protein